MEQIPIRINRKQSNSHEMMFEILPIQKKLQLSCRRQKTYNSIEKQPFEMKNQRKHDTLDPKKIKGEYRYRRISSSGGTHKFPKDFFNHNDLPKTPIKIRFSRTKRQNLNLIQSNATNQFNFISSSLNNFIQPKKKYTLQSPQRNCQLNQLVCQVQTPKFNLKFFADEQDYQGKVKTTHRRVKLDQYLSQKKKQFPNFFRKTDKIQRKSLNSKNSSYQKKQNTQNNGKTTIFEINPDQNLLETLGKNDNFLKQAMIQTKKRKRIQSIMEKQNQKPYEPEKTNKKCLKVFFQTKGLNWKNFQKINPIKQQTIVEQQKSILLNLRLKKNTTNLRKGLSQKLDNNNEDQLLGNTFRIRKCT